MAHPACAQSFGTKAAGTDAQICIHLSQEHRAPTAMHIGRDTDRDAVTGIDHGA
jgi:hypothetical protein